MNPKNSIFFTSCNEDYAMHAITSLLMIRRHIPDVNLAILGKEFTSAIKQKMAKHDIECVEMNLTKEFYRTWQYPLECYYIFAGPEYFLEKGYDYSVYIDVDVVVTSGQVLLEKAPSTFAGVGYSECGAVFGEAREKIQKAFKIESTRLERYRLQSGVVYFNDNFAKKIQLLKKSAEIFDKCIKIGEPRKGDDSLFALIQAIECADNDLMVLDERYNFIPTLVSKKSKNIISFHFTETGTKPWARKNGDEYDKYKAPWQSMLRKVSFRKYVENLFN